MVSRFEDLVAWQKARALAKTIYKVTKVRPIARDFRFSSQIQSASISIMSNIAEGFERSSMKEFHRYLSIAKASCAEVRSQLYIAKDIEYISNETFESVMKQAIEVTLIVVALRKSIERKFSL